MNSVELSAAGPRPQRIHLDGAERCEVLRDPDIVFQLPDGAEAQRRGGDGQNG